MRKSFLHYDFWHIAFNTFALVIFAPPLERMIGHGRFAAFYLLVGTLANVLTYFTKINEPFYGQAGASGAILGLLGFLCLLESLQTDGHHGRRYTACVYLHCSHGSLYVTWIERRCLRSLVRFRPRIPFRIRLRQPRRAVPFTRPFQTGRRTSGGPVFVSGSGQLGRIFFYVIIAFAVLGLFFRYL
ncbi:rhomboid family intramembrane serine protease [Exiguobacterium sp. 9-2]|uniref:rhomboid family intramembrane serine protease n=1 Tax=Exiguobacterium sp. 9-2 TaxID=3112419 RepID=UPI003FA58199